MFQERYPGQRPNFQSPKGPFRQQRQPMFQRMPQENRPFLEQRPQQPQMGRPLRQNGPQQPPKGNGLLGKLFRKSQQTPQNLFAPPSGMRSETRNSGGGFLDTLKNPEGLNTMLTNTQKVLQAAEQFTPMIQQYGPIVKNIPSIWKMMRAINSSDNENKKSKKETSAKKQQESTETLKSLESSESIESTESSNENLPKQPVQKKNSKSVPKLYI